MLYDIKRVTTPMYVQRYMEYVLEVYEQLNMAYPFTASLAYLSSPVLMNEEIFLAFDDDDYIVGCLSFIRGTAQHDYSNREIIQLQVIYIEPSYRSSGMLLSFLQMLVQYAAYKEELITELQFWCKDDPSLRKLIARRFDLTPEFIETEDGMLNFYSLPFTQVQSYVNQFPQVQYF